MPDREPVTTKELMQTNHEFISVLCDYVEHTAKYNLEVLQPHLKEFYVALGGGIAVSAFLLHGKVTVAEHQNIEKDVLKAKYALEIVELLMEGERDTHPEMPESMRKHTKVSYNDMAKACDHLRVPNVEFDEKAAKEMSVEDIRERWPRGESMCPDCGVPVIKYASEVHYLMGDW